MHEPDFLAAPTGGGTILDRWDDHVAASLSELELLRYRSNLLGSDRRVTNAGGENTSAKLTAADPLSRESLEVLWVKGSGGDLGSANLDGFASLSLEKLRGLTRMRGSRPPRRSRTARSTIGNRISMCSPPGISWVREKRFG